MIFSVGIVINYCISIAFCKRNTLLSLVNSKRIFSLGFKILVTLLCCCGYFNSTGFKYIKRTVRINLCHFLIRGFILNGCLCRVRCYCIFEKVTISYCRKFSTLFKNKCLCFSYNFQLIRNFFAVVNIILLNKSCNCNLTDFMGCNCTGRIYRCNCFVRRFIFYRTCEVSDSRI